jgi:hypothetical protein
MRRVLVVLVVLVVVAGAFVAGALIVRDDNARDDKVVESEIHCRDTGDGECGRIYRTERRTLCDDADVTRITIVYEYTSFGPTARYPNRPSGIVEKGRRTLSADC